RPADLRAGREDRVVGPGGEGDRPRGREGEVQARDGGGMTVPPSDHWAPYAPDDKAPWDLRRAVHLHRRAGFAAGWDELQRDLKDGPERGIDRVLKGAGGPHTPGEFADTAELLADSAVAAGEVGRL